MITEREKRIEEDSENDEIKKLKNELEEKSRLINYLLENPVKLAKEEKCSFLIKTWSEGIGKWICYLYSKI
ncbi:unnamed protein product [marine sediment metagenome]|uniref:Uncharacterized protein n=1 Tax=marine sediment metagenome TaxID=412755 RepID=X1TFC5_9ZZZZ